MRFFTFPALLAAAVFSAIVAVPFLPGAKQHPNAFMVEVRLSSDVAGVLQLFYDDGAGLREALSARGTVAASSSPQVLRLSLPPGRYQGLRIDPLERAGNVTVEAIRIVTESGRTVADVPLDAIKAIQQVDTLRLADRALHISITAGSNDPQLAITFAAAIVVRVSWAEELRAAAPVLLSLFAAVSALLFLLDRAVTLRQRLATQARRLAAHPGRAVCVVAAIAVVASAYPVVFLGKSFVSPNLGTILLYDTFPTLPGYTSSDVVDVKLSDIGAVMWQHVPFSMLQHRALTQGELPLWNRYNAAGVPLLAQGQSMFGDPVHLLVIAANGAAWAWDFKYLVAKWLFATGLGLTVLALLRGRSGPASAVASSVASAPLAFSSAQSLPSGAATSPNVLVASGVVRPRVTAAPTVGLPAMAPSPATASPGVASSAESVLSPASAPSPGLTSPPARALPPGAVSSVSTVDSSPAVAQPPDVALSRAAAAAASSPAASPFMTAPLSRAAQASSAAPATAAPSSSTALAAALIIAGAAPFIGFFLYRINHPAFFSLCYAPWPLYCLVRMARAATRRGVGLWAVGLIFANLALMNSGTVKEAYMLLACMNFSGTCILLAHPAPWRDRLAKLAELAWAGVIFVLLTAPIWATFLQTLKSAYTGYNAVSAYQIQPSLLLGAFDEIFYRPLMNSDWVFSPSLNFLLLMGVLYFLATLREHFTQRAVIALAASSLLPLALAFGLISPAWIVTLPFLGNIAHLDNTFSCALVVLWSVLAGVGFATAARRLGTRAGRADLIIAGLLLGALVFAWIAFRQAAHRPIFGPIFSVHQPGQMLAITPFIWNYLIALLIAVAALALLTRGAFARRCLSPARGLLMAGCVATLLWRHGLHANTVGFDAFTARPTQRVDFHARSAAMEFARAAHAREPGRGFGFQGNFFPGWTGVYGLETVHGPDALVNPWLRELVGVSGIKRLWDWRLYVDANTFAAAQPFLDALNVRFYFDMLTKDPALTPALTFAQGGDLDVYESGTAWPRAFFTDQLEVYDQPAELVEKFRAAAGRPFAAMQRSDADSAAALAGLLPGGAPRGAVPATGYRLTENTTSFHVRADGPGMIVLTEAFWPGDFRAVVNGRKQPILRVNHAFKGIRVNAAGDYAISIQYWPKNFPRNLLLCGVGLVFLAASLVLALRPGTTTRPA